MEKLLDCQEIKLTQKAHQLWLLNGDRNTKYFHLLLSQKRTKCKILAVKNNDGHWTTTQEELKALAWSHFQNQFTEIESSRRMMDLQLVQVPQLNEDRLRELTKPSPEEIRNMIFNPSPDKAPGPDGFTIRFYQTFWNIVGPQLLIC